MAVNTFVAPDITNSTLWPEPTNAATNYRNQSTAQFTFITNQLNLEMVKVVLKEQSAWVAPTLQNGWVNYGGAEEPAGYCKNELGIVRIRGFITGGTTTAGTIILALPVGYRPPYTVTLTASWNGTVITLRINSSGTMTIANLNGNTLTPLDFSFRVEL